MDSGPKSPNNKFVKSGKKSQSESREKILVDSVKGKEKEREKGGRNTTVKENNSVLSILLLGHDRGYFLYLCMCNFFFLIRYSNIFSLDSDQFFLPLSTNLLFGLVGSESIPVLEFESKLIFTIYIYIFEKIICFNLSNRFHIKEEREKKFTTQLQL